MIRRWLKSVLDSFGRRYDYDISYAREIVDLDRGGGIRLALASPFLLYRFGAAKEVYFAAKIRSTLRADCGPCLRLVVNMATEAGVGLDTILAALGKGIATPDVALALRYADAVLDNAPELMEVTEEVRQRFGERTRAGLATAIVAGQFYPTLKRGLGHAHACAPVVKELLAVTHDGRREATRHAAE
jgi:hypothetical protein